MNAARKLGLVAAGLAAAGLAGLAGAASSGSSAATVTTAANLAGCFGHAGVQMPGHVAYECLYVPPGHLGALYFSQNLYAFAYYWHPAAGDMVVTEVYYKPPGSRWAKYGVPAADDPLRTPISLPLPPRSNGRIVTLADGCIVAAPSIAVVPTVCTGTSQGGQPDETKQMTTAEQASIKAFWSVMYHLPGVAW